MARVAVEARAEGCRGPRFHFGAEVMVHEGHDAEAETRYVRKNVVSELWHIESFQMNRSRGGAEVEEHVETEAMTMGPKVKPKVTGRNDW